MGGKNISLYLLHYYTIILLLYYIVILDYVSIGPRFSNLVLQALLVLLRKQPPTVGTLSCDTHVTCCHSDIDSLLLEQPV